MLSPQHLGSAEAARPVPIRQHDDFRAAGLILRRREPAAPLRVHAENILERRGRPAGGARSGSPSAVTTRLGERPADRRKHLLSALPVVILGERRRTGRTGWLGVEDHHEVLGLRKGSGFTSTA